MQCWIMPGMSFQLWISIRCGVSTVVTVMTSSFWDIMPCLDEDCYLSPKLHSVLSVYIGSEVQGVCRKSCLSNLLCVLYSIFYETPRIVFCQDESIKKLPFSPPSHSVLLYITSTLVILAIYISASCQPCLIQGKQKFLYLFLSSTESVIGNFCFPLCIILSHSTVDEEYFYKILNICLLWYILGRCIASEHTFLNWVNVHWYLMFIFLKWWLISKCP